MNFRIGNGMDCHELVPNRKLILGGILIDSKIGSSGHSDGDAVIHALVDSMLGALALGDIGTFFPSNEKKWKNADSSIFLDFAKKNKLGFLALEYSGHGKSSGKFINGNISKWTKETSQLLIMAMLLAIQILPLFYNPHI